MKIKNNYLNTALLDGDVILWVCTSGNKSYDHNNKVIRGENGNIKYTDKTLEEVYRTADEYLNDLFNLVRCDSFIIYLTEGKCFRNSISEDYKGNRKKIQKPNFYKEAKQYLIDRWEAKFVEGLEADDLCVISLVNLESSFIISADKDITKSVKGNHFRLLKGDSHWVQVSQEEAEYNFAISLLVGDTIDNIHNLKLKYGIKTATKELNETMSTYKVDAITAAGMIYRHHLGDYDGIIRFSKQYQMLKILDSFYQIPQGINFEIPEPNCYNCLESVMSQEILEEKLNSY